MRWLRQATVSTALTAIVVYSGTAAAQETNHSAHRRAPLLDRLRRSLTGEPETPPKHLHPTPAGKTSGDPAKSDDGGPTRLTNQSATTAKARSGPSSETKAPTIKSSTSRTSSSRRTTSRPQPVESETPTETPTEDTPTLADEPELAMVPDKLGRDDLESESAVVAGPARPHASKPVKTENKRAASDESGDPKSLFVRTMPKVTIQGTGPHRLSVGQPADYKLVVANHGDQPASDLVVMVSLPDTAELSSTRPSAGTIDGSPGGCALQWAIRTLPPGKHEELALRIVPHDSAALALDVRCGIAAVSAKTTLDVQEAKLALQIDGAVEVLCGEKEIYRLTVSNPGNGPAENAVIHLMPLPPDEGAPATHRIGTLAAGETKVVEIELVARQGGPLTIQARATADGGIHTTAGHEVAVRQPAVQVEVAGPPRQYAGAPATYRLRVRNSGDATARRVKVTAVLPEGSECAAASHDAKIDIKHGRATWSLSSLPAGAEQLFTVKCLMKSPGENRLEATVTADGNLKHSNVALTDVTAVADLVLDVVDPSGAVPIGQDSVYEVRVRNRGDRAAEGVDVTAFFSNGVEPFSTDGPAHSISSGTVVFETLPSLGAGEE
ncbi:MAG TPA: hypothetical protein PK867_21975, partial [Pirellulales bacterium]|nr:hypothetical protein [Pirellulales bacterium]